MLLASVRSHFPKLRYPLPMQIIYVKLLLGVAQNVEELEEPLLKLIAQHMAYLDSEATLPPRFVKDKPILLR